MNRETTWHSVVSCALCFLFFFFFLTPSGGCRKSEDTSREVVKSVFTSDDSSGQQLENASSAETIAMEPSTVLETEQEPVGILEMKEVVPVRRILEGMVSAYKNAQTYRDCGEICVSWTQNGKVYERHSVYRTNFQRPNHLLLEVNQTGVLADGENMYAYIEEMPGLLLRKACPEKIGILDILSEREIYWSITDVESNRFCSLPPALVLLLSEKPLDTFLHQINQGCITLLTPETWDGHECYRISAKREEKETVFWIDKETSVLRRVKLPGQVLQEESFSDTMREEMVVTLDFYGAELNWTGVLEMHTPASAVEVSSFMESQINMLGKAFPAVKLTTMDGQPWALPENKTTFLFFWSVYDTNRFHLLNMEELYQRFAKEKDLVFLGINIDPPSVSTDKICESATKLGITCPVVYDNSGKFAKMLRNGDSFACFLLDKHGVIQFCDTLSMFSHGVHCEQKIEQVIAGNDVVEECIEACKQAERDYLESIRLWIENGIFLKEANTEKIAIATKKIAPASEPITYNKKLLWKCDTLDAPSWIQPLPEDGKLLVIENGCKIREVAFDGKILAQHELKLPEDEYLKKCYIYKQDSNGRTYFAMIGKRITLFNDAWEPVMVYPDVVETDAPKEEVNDAILDDLDGDGMMELYVAFWNEDGIHKVSLAPPEMVETTKKDLSLGKEELVQVADEISTGVLNVFKMVAVKTGKGHDLRVVDQSGNIVIFDPRNMEIVATQVVAQRSLCTLTAFDFENEGSDTLAALALGNQVKYKALGVSLEGTELWSIDLPNHIYQRNIEKIHPLFVFNQNKICSGWLLLGADSSIFFVDSSGMMIDQFNFGEIITGSASAVMNGIPTLWVATPRAIHALEFRH